MSRRVSEPSPQRRQAQGVWGVEDLRKRPAPIMEAGDSDVPWARRSKGFDDANQTISSNSFTNLTFNKDYNMGAGESGETYFAANGTNGIEVLVGGFYIVTCEVNWFSGMGTTAWLMGINPLAPVADYNSLDAKGASNSTTMTGVVTKPMRITPGRIIRIEVWQISGVDKAVDVCLLEIARLGSYSGTDPESMNPNA